MKELNNITKSILVVVSTNITDDTGDVLISDAATMILYWIIYTFLCQAINVFGTTTNIINIVCFVKQGFKDPVNVSLLGMGIIV